MSFNANQKIKEILKASDSDPDAASVFYVGDGRTSDRAVIIIKPKEKADVVIKWLLNQGLVTNNPVVRGKE